MFVHVYLFSNFNVACFVLVKIILICSLFFLRFLQVIEAIFTSIIYYAQCTGVSTKRHRYLIDLLHVNDLIIKLYVFIPYLTGKMVSGLSRVIETTTNSSIIFGLFLDI